MNDFVKEDIPRNELIKRAAAMFLKNLANDQYGNDYFGRQPLEALEELLEAAYLQGEQDAPRAV